MKFANITITLATAGSVVAAQPHRHHHHHANKRSPDGNTAVVNVPGPTVLAFELNGKLIPQSDVCEGITKGSLKWADGSNDPNICSSSASSSSVTSSSATSSAFPSGQAYYQEPSTSTAVTSSTSPSTTTSVYQAPSSSAYQAPSSSSAPAPTSSASSAPVSYSYSGSSTSDGSGLTTEFLDGQISCDTFPSNYGPVEVSWAGFDGWSGVQTVTIAGDDPTTDAVTLTGTGSSCVSGTMCSYACPGGYQKSQWPSSQGNLGQSIGGIYCGSDNMLHLTNPSLSKNLCIPGVGGVSVQNKLSQNAAICRTDYPGTESETVPLNTMPGSTNDLTCPDSATYYSHENGETTAQYYVNNQGVVESEACIWNSDGSDEGNFAPTYFGVGRDVSGKTWLSIASTIQNNPTGYKDLDYTVEIVGDGLAGTCKYSNGQYCGGGTCTSIQDYYSSGKVPGCTVEMQSGTATYVLS